MIKALKIILKLLILLLLLETATRIVTYGIFTFNITRYPEIKSRYKDTALTFDENVKLALESDPKEMIVPIFTGRNKVELVRPMEIEKKHLKDPDFTDEKNKEMYRIICVGGSTTLHGYVESLI